MNVRYRVELSQAERGELTAMLARASVSPANSSASLVLAADAGRSNEEIVCTVAVSGPTTAAEARRLGRRFAIFVRDYNEERRQESSASAP
jgi:hypothetical protein